MSDPGAHDPTPAKFRVTLARVLAIQLLALLLLWALQSRYLR